MNDRLSKFKLALAKREIDAALITNEKSIRYLCSFPFEDGCLFISSESSYLITDFRYEEEAGKHATDFTVVCPSDRIAFLKQIISQEKIQSIGYENTDMTVSEFHFYADALTPPFVPMSDLLKQMRSIKSTEEISAIKKAQAITDMAFTHILSIMTPNMTECDVALELAYFMQKAGASGVSFDIIAVSGDASALPHGKCQRRKLQKGFLTMDFGCVFEGYCSDMTRTVVIGKASSEMKKLYQTVLDAQLAALSAIKAGACCRDVDAIARNLIENAGYQGAFGHGLGHGVGLDIHEAPRLSPRATEETLMAGHIVTVEPGIYLTGKYGCRIEDMGCVTEQGFDNFTHSDKQLVELFQ